MPVMVLFKYGSLLTLSVINRRLHKTDETKDVLKKVTQIKDIRIGNPHRAHIEILFDLSYDELKRQQAISNFVELHNAWQKTLDIKELNKKFFSELANWHFWATEHVEFPSDLKIDNDTVKDRELRNKTNLIRLITRIIFIWFIKEKDLVPEKLFDKNYINGIITDLNTDKNSENYYHAILQNLFFGTLNQKMGERKFVIEGDFQQNKSEHGIKNYYRYLDKFKIPENEAVKLFEEVPFLNGGLFDCLDKDNDETNKHIYVDGFSRNKKKQAHIPDYLFFSAGEEIDLNVVYGTKNKRYSSKGLFNLLNNYKFTVTENTPIDEEVALDPELLGKVFENLLASYNPETESTARKLTGSFYTPREIVNYMVDESLIASLAQKLSDKNNTNRETYEQQIRNLLDYTDNECSFSVPEQEQLIEIINDLKILDPACGSGAFPMGVLHKMVHVLHKLDPDNSKWKREQREKIIGEKIRELEKDKKVIEYLSDVIVRQKAVDALVDRLKDIEDVFNKETTLMIMPESCSSLRITFME